MIKQILLAISLIAQINSNTAVAMDGDHDPEQRETRSSPRRINSQEKLDTQYLMYISKNSFVAGSTVAVSWWAERWAVTTAICVIDGTIESKNPLFNWIVLSPIRGKAKLEALDIAANKGRIMGIVIAVLAAPLAWDCAIEGLSSYKKIINYVVEEKVPKKEIPKRKDYIKAVLATAMFGIIGYTIYSTLNNSSE